MLYRMHLLLSAEQRTKLEALRARMRRRSQGPRTAARVSSFSLIVHYIALTQFVALSWRHS